MSSYLTIPLINTLNLKICFDLALHLALNYKNASATVAAVQSSSIGVCVNW